VIEYVTIATLGNVTDFGDLVEVQAYFGGCSNATRGIFAGGGGSNVIQYITIASTGNATDFGDLTVTREQVMSVSTDLRAAFAGGESSGQTVNVIDYVTIASVGNATDFGDLSFGSNGARYGGFCSSANGGTQ
jgi:hypothetical protein